MKTSIREWADIWVPKFNELSELYTTGYYTQSPLSVVSESPDLMIIGINPKGTLGKGKSIKTVDEFLQGNPCWGERFDSNDRIAWGKYIGNTHHFLGVDNRRKVMPLDDDTRTIWTNLSPFDSHEGSKDLRKELMEVGVASTLDLISRISPKKIVLLSADAFLKLDKFNPDSKLYPIEHERVLPKYGLEVGRICGIPSISLVHPSSTVWPISNRFTSVFVFLHGMIDTIVDGKQKKLKEVVERMRKEFQSWSDLMM